MQGLTTVLCNACAEYGGEGMERSSLLVGALVFAPTNMRAHSICAWCLSAIFHIASGSVFDVRSS